MLEIKNKEHKTELNMKRILGILLLSLFAFTACNDDSSILEPTFQSSENESVIGFEVGQYDRTHPI